MLELCAHYSRVAWRFVSINHLLQLQRLRTVASADLSPDNPDLRASPLDFGAIDISYALPEVEVCGLDIIHALDLDEGGLRRLCVFPPSKGEMFTPALC